MIFAFCEEDQTILAFGDDARIQYHLPAIGIENGEYKFFGTDGYILKPELAGCYYKKLFYIFPIRENRYTFSKQNVKITTEVLRKIDSKTTLIKEYDCSYLDSGETGKILLKALE